MPYFQYSGLNEENGRKINNSGFFLTEEDLATYCIENRIDLVFSKELKFKIPKFSKDQTIYFFTFLKRLSGARVKATEIFEYIRQDSKDKAILLVSSFILSKLFEGYNISDAMKEEGKNFDPIVISFVEYGEKSNDLKGGFSKALDYINDSAKLHTKIMKAVAYPILLLCVIIAIFIVAAKKIIPSFSELLSIQDEKIPIQMTMMVNSYKFLANNITYCAITIGSLIFFATTLSIISPKARLFVDGLKMKTPFLGKLFTFVEIVKFLSLLSALLKNGDKINDAIAQSLFIVKNRKMVKDLNNLSVDISNGSQIHKAIADNLPYLPSMIPNIIKSGEQSGDFTASIEDVCQIYSDEIQYMTDRFIAILKPAALLIVASLFLLIVSTTFLPLYQKIYSLGSNMN